MYRTQEPPNSIQLEMCEGCQLFCSFCGLQGIRTQAVKNYKFMTAEILTNIADQLAKSNWNPRIEFASHGEPTLHPDYVGMIRLFRERNPKLSLMMTSNGGGLLRSPGPQANINALFNAGLNILALDDYEAVNIVPKIRAAFFGSDTPLVDYPADRRGNPHIRAKPNTRLITILKDISVADKGTHSRLNNHAGAAFPPNQRMAGKRCARPFRELTIRWDGNVAVCCNSWRGQYKCGNVVRDGLEAVWNGRAFGAAREKLYLGERDFGECNGCDDRSYRPGLLPDKMGKATLKAPDAQTAADIAAALAGAPYTQPVKRPWE